MVSTEAVTEPDDEALTREDYWELIKECRQRQGKAAELTSDEHNLSLEECDALLAQEIDQELSTERNCRSIATSIDIAR